MKEKIKDNTKKVLVEEYQKQVQKAVDEIKSRDGKLSSITKDYMSTLEKNIERAPYVLGYLEISIEKKKVGK